MLKISQSPLPQTTLSYVAFRVAFRETFDRLSLNVWYPSENTTPYGFLCEVPFLQEVAPAVQLDLLASTWHKHVSTDVFHSNLVDESVIYAACETAARMVENEPETVVQLLKGGPLDIPFAVNAYLARDLRALYLDLPNDGDFLIVSQFLDAEPEEAVDQKLQMGIDPNRMIPMFDVLGRWHVSAGVTDQLQGLLTDAEASRVAGILRVLCLT